MLGKKGMEISINVIVMIVLGIVMFGASMAIFTNIFQNVVQVGEVMDESITNDIIRRFPSSELVFLPEDNKAPRTRFFGTDKDVVFYIGIRNDQDTRQNFKIIISPTQTSAELGMEDEHIIFDPGPYEIGAKEEKVFLFIVSVEGLPSGSQYGVVVGVEREDLVEGGVPHGQPRIAYVNLR